MITSQANQGFFDQSNFSFQPPNLTKKIGKRKRRFSLFLFQNRGWHSQPRLSTNQTSPINQAWPIRKVDPFFPSLSWRQDSWPWMTYVTGQARLFQQSDSSYKPKFDQFNRKKGPKLFSFFSWRQGSGPCMTSLSDFSTNQISRQKTTLTNWRPENWKQPFSPFHSMNKSAHHTPTLYTTAGNLAQNI